MSTKKPSSDGFNFLFEQFPENLKEFKSDLVFWIIVFGYYLILLGSKTY